MQSAKFLDHMEDVASMFAIVLLSMVLAAITGLFG